MGGNALKDTDTTRLNRDEYFKYSLEICHILKNKLGIKNFSIIPAYTEKESFGDVDILVAKEEMESHSQEDILSAFNSKDSHFNGDVWSLEYKNFQVDLINTPIDEMEIAFVYFSWNDLGNLMGKVAHKFGLKYGHKGLFYRASNRPYMVNDIFITKDLKEVFELLGNDYMRFVRGFNSLDDIFEYTTSSTFFNPDLFPQDGMNYAERDRISKRPTYREFLLWIKGKGFQKYQFEEDKDKYLPMIMEKFPNFEVEYTRLQKLAEERIAVKKKFNGNIVGRVSGLKGKPLGDLLRAIKERFESESEFNSFILDESHDMNFIESYIRRSCNKNSPRI